MLLLLIILPTEFHTFYFLYIMVVSVEWCHLMLQLNLYDWTAILTFLLLVYLVFHKNAPFLFLLLFSQMMIDLREIFTRCSWRNTNSKYL